MSNNTPLVDLTIDKNDDEHYKMKYPWKIIMDSEDSPVKMVRYMDIGDVMKLHSITQRLITEWKSDV